MGKLAMVSDLEPHNAALTPTRAWRASPAPARVGGSAGAAADGRPAARELRKGVSLGELKIRDLINEGRP